MLEEGVHHLELPKLKNIYAPHINADWVLKQGGFSSWCVSATYIATNIRKCFVHCLRTAGQSRPRATDYQKLRGKLAALLKQHRGVSTSDRRLHGEQYI